MKVTEKELKILNRYQLLELLLVQTRRVEELQARLEEVEKQLNEQNLQLSSMGSIAEASVYLSGVLEAAQSAADLYLESVKKRSDEMLAEARGQAEAIVAQAEEEGRSRAAAMQAEQAAGKRKVNETGKAKGKKSSKNRRAKK